MKIQTSQLVRNASVGILQVATVGVSYFVLYRFLLRSIGVSVLGVWSLVLAITSVGRIWLGSVAPSVVTRVARQIALGNRDEAARVVQGGVLLLGTITALTIALLLPVSQLSLRAIIPKQQLEAAMALLPWTLVTIWVTAISSVFQAGLDGAQRVDLRMWLLIAGTLGFLGLSFLLVPTYGLIGLGYAQFIQAAGMLALSAILLRSPLPELYASRPRLEPQIARDLFRQSVPMQASTVLSMLLDPVTKGLLARFGSLSMVGWYDMAQRMIIQLRGLFNTACEALIPAVAHVHVNSADQVMRIYLGAYRVSFLLIFPMLATTLIATPFISELWVGHYETSFVLFSLTLAMGLIPAMLSTPAFMINIGLGRLRANLISFPTMLGVTLLAGFPLGASLGALGVVVAFSVAFMAGAVILVLPFHRHFDVPLRTLLPPHGVVLLTASGLASGVGLGLYYVLRDRLGLATVGALALVACTLLVVPVLKNPTTAELRRLMARSLRGSESA